MERRQGWPRDPWQGQGHMGPMGRTQARAQAALRARDPAAAAWAHAWVRPMGPMCPCPCPKGSKDSLGPHVGMYFHKKYGNYIRFY